MRSHFLIVFLLTFLNQLYPLKLHSQMKDQMPHLWFHAAKPKAVVVLGHGLNVRPSKMDELAQFLQENGSDVYRLNLSGHQESLEDFKIVTWKTWNSEFSEAKSEALARAHSLRVPLFFLGHSLSGILALSEPERFEKLILFSPPIVVKTASKLIRIFQVFGDRFCLKSFNLPEYRAHDCTPMAAYAALFEGISALKMKLSQFNIPTRVFLDPKDELVSFVGLKTFMFQNQLSNWSLSPINANPASQKILHHLIIDEESVGLSQWSSLKRQIIKHFFENNAEQQSFRTGLQSSTSIP